MTERLRAALEGRYRIEREIGEGGMATVYLAEDLRHDRHVAIKVLKPELAAVVGAERFLAEIKTTANLQHPHILPLFDSGEADGFLFYVMPYVEGESLRDRLERVQELGVDEAVRIARDVAEALDYAHRSDVIHRDIKPANILLHDGRPLVADFGIALAVSAAGGGRLTETGLSLGTPHYMSPEQASADREVTPRSDVYSLASVLYEMLAGHPPHTGRGAQSVLVKILTEDPRPVDELRRSVPAHVAAAVMKGLEKLPADRFASAAEFGDALDDEHFRYAASAGTRAASQAAAMPGSAAGPWLADVRSKLALAGMAVLGVAGLFLGRGLVTGSDPPQPAGVHRYVITDSTRASGMDISGRGDVVYSSWGAVRTEEQTGRHLRLRPAADTGVIELPGTEGANHAVFSPDGSWIAFSTDDRELKKIEPSTGTVVSLQRLDEFSYVGVSAWSDDGHILFGGNKGTGSRPYRIPDVGGEPELMRDDHFLGSAELLPDGHTVVFGAFRTVDSASVLAVDLRSGAVDTVAPTGANPQWSPTGHILHGHPSGAIFAVPWDLDRGEPTGPGIPVQESVFTLPGGRSRFVLSPTGSLLYIAGRGRELDLRASTLAWMDVEGGFTDILPMGSTEHSDPRLSPDGQQIAYIREDQLVVLDLESGTEQRLTFEGREHHEPVWSPDGSRIAFYSIRGDGGGGIWVKDAAGRLPARRVVGDAGTGMSVHEWLEDGTLVLQRGLHEGGEILTTRVDDPDPELTPLLRDDRLAAGLRVSPDGGLMAYFRQIERDAHIFVREFPGMAGPWQVSRRPVRGWGNATLAWSEDGAALFYQDFDGGPFVRADLERDPDFRVVQYTRLTGFRGALLEDLHPDGRRFLVARSGLSGSDEAVPPMIVAVNWIEELRQQLRAGGSR